MHLDKTRQAAYVRFTIHHSGLKFSLVDAARWLDKKRIGTAEPRRQMACALRGARQELRIRAATLEVV